MSRVANAQTEEYWVTLARSATASQIETVVRKYRQVERAQEGEETEQQHDRRSLEYYWDENRSLVIRARLPTEEGAIVLNALEAGAGRPWEANREAASNDQEDVSAETSSWSFDAASRFASHGRPAPASSAFNTIAPSSVGRRARITSERFSSQ